MISVRNCDVRTAIEAYKRGLDECSDLYMDLTNTPTNKFAQYHKISSYGLKGTSKEVVETLTNVQTNVKWPRKNERDDAKKDKSKWCDFHSDHGDVTDDCITLRRELARLIPKGHLQDFLGTSIRLASPEHAKVVNCVIGGSDICGLTYSAAKRHASRGPEELPVA
ncbi:hypothetical protein L6452_15384 [Arctium lappa]|uniref:Uncharacterized protein n=1 Tax=Arctium lappa TaxID=4217 RepID=A0ACB9CND8_ARCLA|nr:hypothetical protein L6452_15384 [Arctium lappa]